MNIIICEAGGHPYPWCLQLYFLGLPQSWVSSRNIRWFWGM